MKKIINIKYLAFLFVIIGFASCEKDDYTDHSKLTPTSPTISFDGINAEGETLVEGNQEYTFTVNLSTAQIVDVTLNVTQTAGDATRGADYVAENSIVIPAGSTSASYKVQVLADDLVEDTETFTLTFGDDQTANANLTPVTASFTIMNLTDGDLAVNMSWTTDALDKIGLDIDGTEAVDMRMVIFHVEGDSTFAVSDGGSFENYVFTGSDPDGVYLIASDIYSTIDAGDLNDVLNIDLGLEFNQTGIYNNQSYSFPQALTNEYPCSDYRVNLAEVTKSGESYTLNKALGVVTPDPLTWNGTDGHVIDGGVKTDGPSNIIQVDLCNSLLFGLNKDWMEGFWGEEILQDPGVLFTVEGDNIIIQSQFAFLTLYDGAEYPYTISGTGTIDNSGAYPIMTIDYILDQAGFDPSGWAFANGYMDTDYFTAYISTDPNFFKSGNNSSDSFIGASVKPVTK